MQTAKTSVCVTLGFLAAGVLVAAGVLFGSSQSEGEPRYRSPSSVAFSADGETLYVAEEGSQTVAIVDSLTGKVQDRFGFDAEPVAGRSSTVTASEGSADKGKLAASVSERPPAGELGLKIIHAATSSQVQKPVAQATNFRLEELVFACRRQPDGEAPPIVGVVDRRSHRAFFGPTAGGIGDLPGLLIDPNPQDAAITPDRRRLLITCDMLTEENRAVCIVDRTDGSVSRIIIPGGTSLRGVAVSPDGRFALVAHVQARSHLPATQISRGWVFTNVVTWLPLDPLGEPVSLPLDNPTEFFATPFDVEIAGDGRTAYVSHAGADVVSVLDLKALENTAQELAARGEQYPSVRDLRLSQRYVTARILVGANPRDLALGPAGDQLVVANHLDDSLSVIDTTSNEVIRTIRLDTREVDLARRGEQLFNSAKLSFSGQFACASCHPDGRTDGLDWDLAADGIGNFKNTKTLRGVRGTEPFGWLGTTETLPERFGTTLRQTFQHEPTDQELRAITAYLEQLGPSGEPASADATPAVSRGRELFYGKAGCAVCHRGPHLTDRRRHNIGTAGPTDLSDVFDAPSLIGVADTPPYLHDGRAPTLESIFREHNPSGRHGNADRLTSEELRDLIAFLRSL